MATAAGTELSDAKQAFLAIPTEQTFSELNSAYNHFYTTTIEDARHLQVLLAIAILLFLVLIIAANRLNAAKRKIQSTSQTLSDAVARLTEGFALFSRAGNPMLCNKAWRSHFGFTDEDELPQKLSDWQQRFAAFFVIMPTCIKPTKGLGYRLNRLKPTMADKCMLASTFLCLSKPKKSYANGVMPLSKAPLHCYYRHSSAN